MFKKKNKNAEELETTVTNKKTKKKFKKRYIVIGAIVLIIVVNTISGAMAGSAPMTVDVRTVTKGELTQTLDTSGTVESEEVKRYFAKTSGQIETLNVTLGETVKAGDNLLSYDVAKLEKQVKQAELEMQASDYGIDATITSLNNAQAKAAEAAKDYDEAVKYVQHYTDCVNSVKAELTKAAQAAQEVESLTAKLTDAQAKLQEKPNSEKRQQKVEDLTKELKTATKEAEKYDVAALNASLEVCSADLAAYESLKAQYEAGKETDPSIHNQRAQQTTLKEVNQLSKEQTQESLSLAKEGVTADFDGIVTAVTAVEGMSVTEGMELFTIANDKQVKVTIEVSKYDLPKIALNQRASIEINNKEYEGYVARIDRFAHANASGASVLSADIHIDNPDENIYLGIEGKVSIQTADVADAILVPMECINSDTDGDFCYVVKDNIVVRKDVEIGISSDEYTQIISGLSEGEQVIAVVTSDITEGMEVTPMDMSELEATKNGENATDSEENAESTQTDDSEANEDSAEDTGVSVEVEKETTAE